MTARQRLIDSTRELLWERGYVGTSPRAIQQRAGAGPGSMYHHFTDKAALALVAIEAAADELLVAAEACLARPGTAVERISGWLHREREVLRGCPIGRLTQDPEVLSDDALRAPVAATFDRLQSRVAEVIRAGQQRGEFGPGRAGVDPCELAATIIAVLQGGYVLARAAGSVRPFEQAVNGALALLATAQLADAGGGAAIRD